MTIKDNVKGGALTEITLLVLLAVYQPNHGYGILQFIMRETHGRVSPGAGTLYGAIGNLARKKFIAPIEVKGPIRKKLYVITELGQQIVEKEIGRLKNITVLASRIVNGEDNGDE